MTTIFLILAAICFLLAAVGVPVPRLNLIGAGLFLWVVSTMV
jgi:hypothetical protein